MEKITCLECGKKKGMFEKFTTNGFCLPCSKKLHKMIDEGKLKINNLVQLIHDNPQNRSDPETIEAAKNGLLDIYALEKLRARVAFFKSSLDDPREFLETLLQENGVPLPHLEDAQACPVSAPVPSKSHRIPFFIVITAALAITLLLSFIHYHRDIQVKDGHFTISMDEFSDRIFSVDEFRSMVVREQYNFPRYNYELQNDVSIEMMCDFDDPNAYITNIWITTSSATEDSVRNAYSAANICISQLYPSWSEKEQEEFLLDIANGAVDASSSEKSYSSNYNGFRWYGCINEKGLKISVDCFGNLDK